MELLKVSVFITFIKADNYLKNYPSNFLIFFIQVTSFYLFFLGENTMYQEPPKF